MTPIRIEALEGSISTYSVPQSCMTWSFKNPRICSFDGSGIRLGETRTGPAANVVSSLSHAGLPFEASHLEDKLHRSSCYNSIDFD